MTSFQIALIPKLAERMGRSGTLDLAADFQKVSSKLKLSSISLFYNSHCLPYCNLLLLDFAAIFTKYTSKSFKDSSKMFLETIASAITKAFFPQYEMFTFSFLLHMLDISMFILS